MPMITRQIGNTVELRYDDIPLWSEPRSQEVLNTTGRLYLELALQYLAGQISDVAPVGVSGSLAQSFAGGPFGGREMHGETFDGLEGRIFSSLPHAIVMDQGRTPGARMPPVDALLLWVERVMGVPAGEAQGVAFAVARSIGRKGIDARHFVDTGIQKAMPGLEQIFQSMEHAIAARLEDPTGDQGGPATVAA